MSGFLPPILANRDEPRAFHASGEDADIEAGDGKGKLPSFRGNAYTGAPMRPGGWWGKVIIDLAGVKVPSQGRPVLRQHDHEQIVGHTTAVKVTKDGIRVEGVFSGEKQHVEKVTTPAKNGFKWQLSVGANPVRTEYLEAGETTTVNGREVTGPMTISRETELGEISFVPLGADQDTSVSVAAELHRGTTMNPFAAALKHICGQLVAAGKAAPHTDEAIAAMTEDQSRLALNKCMDDEEDAEAADDDDEDDDDEEPKKKAKAKAKAKAKKADAAGRFDMTAAAKTFQKEMQRVAAEEQTRQVAIRACVTKHGVTEVEITAGRKVNLIAHAIAEGWTPDQAELHALRAARDVHANVGVPGGLGYSTSTPQADEAVLEAAVLHAARHQFQLNNDSFYREKTPDGSGEVRRISEQLQRETQSELRARYSDDVQQKAHTLFKGRMGLHQLLSTIFKANGFGRAMDLRSESGIRSAMQAWDHVDRQSIQAEGPSNLSISNILANVLNKFALQGYLFVEQAWREISAIRTVSDFKPTKSINLLGTAMYKALGSTGELQNASFGDQAFSNQAQPYGIIATIPWVHLVNDDLSMLTGVPTKIGQGAGLALNDAFWSLWAAATTAATVNGVPAPLGDDGLAFWRTTSLTTTAAKRAGTAYLPNKTTGAGSVLSTTSLATVRALFDNQIDPNGNPLGFDGAMPILLHGPTNWQTAMQLLYGSVLIAVGLASTTAASVQPAQNVWAGTARPVMSRYLENANYAGSATAWWMLFNSAALPVIETAFLNGIDTPAVLQASPDFQFDRLGISIRGTMPFGVNVQNFRGGVFAAGA